MARQNGQGQRAESTSSAPDRREYGRLVDVDNLQIAPGPGAPRGLTVPGRELVEQFSHASGPGGQGVNTADSRVQLSLDLATTTALNEDQRELALERLAARLSGTVLTVTAAEHRTQRSNRAAARERLAGLLRDAVAPPIVRRPTRRTRGSQRRRLQGKRRRSEIKQNRRRPHLD
jgi:ribosome-associated protein